MARSKSEDKRLALLEAAKVAVAEQGLGAATSLIAKNAGVAEGTLFRYFSTKDKLLNELYLYIKLSLGKTMMENYLPGASFRERARTVWSGFISWGLIQPAACKAMRQLAVSDKITTETLAKVNQHYPELDELAEACVTSEFFSCRKSAFADAIFFSLAQTTTEFAALEPENAEFYKTAGFEIMWRAMTKAD